MISAQRTHSKFSVKLNLLVRKEEEVQDDYHHSERDKEKALYSANELVICTREIFQVIKHT